ncbi:proline--tRNA ligase [Tepidiforma sp.]|uniref:proline--tRNA ligase n=1 Tax=Tepidiforma sp. TaxID=2682230 RepID=UPI002ADE54CF|nr:proline--tRNA ligase [Tepidiforma sp.]
MRMRQMLVKTLREVPSEAELASHRLLLRAGLVVPLAAGLYCFTPLGWRVVRKIEAIIREEMNRSGAQEVHLPALHPIELWEQSGRAALMGPTLFRLIDRKERTFALGPTHEEVISYLASRAIQSYRDLPVTLYQIQTKFRDEPRPRGGLIRLREFTMKDAYSFDTDWDTLDASYDAAFAAYERIFRRAGVPVLPVAADSGAIGGKDSQEFIFLTESGEDTILLCPGCNYAANAEKAEFTPPPPIPADPLPVEKVHTPGQRTIAEVAAFLGVEPRQTLKAVFYRADGQPVFVAIRGDLEVNEVKLKNALHATDIEPMDEETVKRLGLVAGSASPVGIEGMTVVADPSAVEGVNLVAGANEPDYHLKNTNHGRDWNATLVAEIALAREGDACRRCGAALAMRRGIEMGHVFKLGTLYSEKMGVYYLDERGERRPCVMGCYGIGVERMLAAIIEANHDADGITWPWEVAPFDVHVVVLGGEDPAVADALARLETELAAAGLEQLIDDRDDSPGIKFKDADLLGMPKRVTVSPRALERGGVELRDRRTGATSVVAIEEAARLVADERAGALGR